jgi:predicted O-methyltransferase YrrM
MLRIDAARFGPPSGDAMNRTYRTDDWDQYRMDYHAPFGELEPLDREVELVDGVLVALVEAGALPATGYDGGRLLAHRRAVRTEFEIPWTAISPRMERLIYAVNAIARPDNMIAAGVFCGFTFICNAGAAVGPGRCYEAKQLIGVEIKPQEAERAERNVRRIDLTGIARVVAEDAVETLAAFPEQVQLLYLDANGAGGRGKSVYLDILEAGYDRLPAGALVLAHNSVNAADRLEHYLDFVRDPAHFRASIGVVLDPEGLEVSVK